MMIIIVSDITADLSSPDIEGVYETQVPLELRALVGLGCLVTVDRGFAKMMAGRVRPLSFRSVCLSVCLPVCLRSVCLSVCLRSVCLSVCLRSVCLICLRSVCLSVCLRSVCLSAWLSACVFE